MINEVHCRTNKKEARGTKTPTSVDGFWSSLAQWQPLPTNLEHFLSMMNIKA